MYVHMYADKWTWSYGDRHEPGEIAMPSPPAIRLLCRSGTTSWMLFVSVGIGS